MTGLRTDTDLCGRPFVVARRVTIGTRQTFRDMFVVRPRSVEYAVSECRRHPRCERMAECVAIPVEVVRKMRGLRQRRCIVHATVALVTIRVRDEPVCMALVAC